MITHQATQSHERIGVMGEQTDTELLIEVLTDGLWADMLDDESDCTDEQFEALWALMDAESED
jgi:hypothetical protein